MTDAGETRVVYVERRKKQFGCGGCLLVLLAIFGIGKAKGWWDDFSEQRQQDQQREEQQKQREAIESQLQDFARKQAPAVLDSIDELKVMESVMLRRVERRRTDLVAFGRQPEQDQVYVGMQDRLKQLRATQRGLTRQLEDAYLLWRTFVDSGDPAEEKRFQDAIRAGEQSAKDTTRRLRELMEEKESGR
ncbi:MAG: hypothetical protein AAGD14_19015 [Planctomycetota bacterium]